MAESEILIPLHEALRRNARQHPERDAYIWYGQHISWRQVDEASDAVAAHLQQLGVKKGEPVALFMNNCPQYIVAHYAVQKIGAIVCPCGPLNKEHELEYQLNDLQARVIIAADVLLPVVDKVRAAPRCSMCWPCATATGCPPEPRCPCLPSCRPPCSRCPQCDVVLGSHAQRRQAFPCRGGHGRGGADDLYLGHHGPAQGRHAELWRGRVQDGRRVPVTGVSAEDVLLAVAPLYHIAGMSMGVNMPVHSGAPCVLLHRFDPLAVAQALERYRVSWWYSIAPMNVALMQVPGVEKMDFSALRRNTVTSFGITYTEDLAQQWRRFAPNAISSEAAYGLSETHTMDTFMPGDAIRWGTHGKPAPGNEIRVIDPETGAPLAAGEVGEIIIRGPGNFKGYWNKPEATAKTLKNGWVHTGDMGKFDADGYLTFIGRFKEMIKVSGYSVFPEEVETILIKHPAIAQAAVIGVADPERRGRARLHRAQARAEPGGGRAAGLEQGKHGQLQGAARGALHRCLPATGAGKVLRRCSETFPDHCAKSGCPWLVSARSYSNESPMFKKVLIANRGEIALRIIRALQELGIASLAVYAADDAGPACAGRRRGAGTGRQRPGCLSRWRAAAAYRAAARLRRAAPGLWLSQRERGLCARLCGSGLRFIGPTPEQLALLGDKARARALAQQCGVPLMPGSTEAVTLEQAQQFFARQQADGASGIMIKAIGGGGGRGMRAVTEAARWRPPTSAAAARRRQPSAWTASMSSG
jgi:long-chain acyl-CoA synthetase